jgi:cytidylate kinase
MFRVVTVAREYGSGANAIAKRVAQRLGWTLLDEELIGAIARAGKVDVETARRYDERVDSWWHRFNRNSLRGAAIYAGANVADTVFFDAKTMVGLARQLIARRAAKGNCVIVGRGAQCVLQTLESAFHAFIYAPLAERIERVGGWVDGCDDLEEYIRSIDHERARYIHTYFGCDWKDPHLYHMMISSQIGTEAAAGMIVDAIRNSGVVAKIRISLSLPIS